MKGHVDEFGRALLELNFRAGVDCDPNKFNAWIDTAFTGELVMPKRLIDQAKLEQSAAIEARLADGQEVILASYACLLDWFGKQLEVEVVANDGDYPLLGVGLLVGRDLQISYRTGEVAVS